MMTTGEILTLLRARGYAFNRALGQHFLADDDVIARIVEGSRIGKDDNVLEIGPGAGVLTGPLCVAAKKVLAVELDRALMPVLETTLHGYSNVTVVREDILRADIGALARECFGGEDFLVVSNLPYSITTPILTRLLQGDLPIPCITVMVQSEAALRVVAQSGKDYGPLAILAQYRCEIERIADVERSCFVPPPHVDSTVLRLCAREGGERALDEVQFFRLVRAAFAMRRKTLSNNLAPWKIPKENLQKCYEECGLTERVRAEQVSLPQFIALSNSFVKSGYVIF